MIEIAHFQLAQIGRSQIVDAIKLFVCLDPAAEDRLTYSASRETWKFITYILSGDYPVDQNWVKKCISEDKLLFGKPVEESSLPPGVLKVIYKKPSEPTRFLTLSFPLKDTP